MTFLFALQLQDLAVNPGIRDPSLNTAECVIQGHKPSFETTGRTAYIRAMLWLMPIFVLFSGPLLASYMMDVSEVWDQEHNEWKKNRAKAVCTSFYVLSVLGNVLLFVAFILSCYSWANEGQATFDIPIIFLIMILLIVSESCFTLKKCATPNGQKWYLCVIAICGANAVSYLFCWLIIGIRINPTWGLTIALIVMSLSATLTYASYVYLEATYTTGYNHVTSSAPSTTSVTTGSDNTNHIQVIMFCVSGCLAVLLLFVIVVLAGQSYRSEKVAADEVLKTTSLYFISAFISWVTWKKHASHQQSETKEKQNTQPTSNGNPEENDQNTPRQGSRPEDISLSVRRKTPETST